MLSYHLRRLGIDQVGPYVQHRLQVASGGITPRVVFEPEAIARIGTISNGTPRLINNVCDAALLAAFADETAVITTTVIDSVANEMTICGWGTPPDSAEDNYKLPTAIAG